MSAGRHRLLTISAAIAVGVLVALQSRINAELSQYVGGGVIAAAVSFGTGLVLAWVIVSSRAPLRASVAALPGLLRDRRGGQWIYYRLNPELPSWARDILDAVESGMRDQRPFVDDRAFIADSMDRRACGE